MPSEESRLLALLRGIERTGSIAAGAREVGISYRLAWGQIEKWQNLFGQTLVAAGRGSGSRLTAFALRLLSLAADTDEILSPHLEAAAVRLREGLAGENHRAPVSLSIYASHDLALSILCERMQEQGHQVALHFRGSTESLALLARDECDAAGFHCPEGHLGRNIWALYRQHLQPRKHLLLSLGTRTQGIMVRSGNPKEIRTVSDLASPGVRFLNRQPGAGTRIILDLLLREQGIPPSQIRGYSSEEFTHAAVAAMIASGEVDAGLGIEAAARHFGLGFIPVLRERYFLALRASRQEQAPMRALRAAIGSGEFLASATALGGYAMDDAGGVLQVTQCDALWSGAPSGGVRRAARSVAAK